MSGWRTLYLLVDCRSAAGPFKWLRINDEGPTSGGVAERNRDRKELATVATTQPEFNGYVMDQGRNPLYLYIGKEALKEPDFASAGLLCDFEAQ